MPGDVDKILCDYYKQQSDEREFRQEYLGEFIEPEPSLPQQQPQIRNRSIIPDVIHMIKWQPKIP